MSIFKHMRYSVVLTLVASSFFACGDDDPPSSDDVGQVQLAVIGGETHDVSQFEFRLIESGTGDCATGTVIASQTVPLEDETLPPSLGGGADHRFADGLFIVAPDSYLACALPLTVAATPSVACAPASGIVTAVAGSTVETVLVSQCLGDDSGGIDLVGTLNTPPAVDDLVIAPSKFIRSCEAADITLTASDVDGDPLSYSWLVTLQPAGSNPVITGAADAVSFSTDLPGDYEVTVTVTDAHAATTSLSFPIHVQDLPCAGEAHWLYGGGANLTELVSSLDVDRSGNVFATGFFTSPSLTIGTNTFIQTDPGWSDMFLIKLDADGNLMWSRGYGALRDFSASFIGLDASEEHLYVAGSYATPPNFGCPITWPNDELDDVFVVKLRTSNASCVAAYAFATPGRDFPMDAAVGADDSLYVVGSDHPALGAPSNAFYLKLSSALAEEWNFTVSGAQADRMNAVDINAAGDLVMAGWTQSATLSFPRSGGGTHDTDPLLGTQDVFVARVDPSTGLMDDLTSSAAAGYEDIVDIAIDAGGNVATTGVFNGDLAFGGLTGPPGAADFDGFVAYFDSATPLAAATWARSGNSSQAAGLVVELDADGDVILAGAAAAVAPVDFGVGPQHSAFLVTFEPTAGIASDPLSGTSSSGDMFGAGIYDMALDADGDLIVGGGFGGVAGDTFTIGGGPVLVSAGEADFWLGKLER